MLRVDLRMFYQIRNEQLTNKAKGRNVDYFARQSEATVCFVGNGFVFVKTHQNGITVKFSDTFFLKTYLFKKYNNQKKDL